MANLMSLPNELISHILMQENIDVEDVVNLSLTCKRLYMVIHNDYLWRRKFFQRWPSLKKVHAGHLNNRENMKEMVKEGMGHEKELLYYISILPYIYSAKVTNATFKKNINCLGWNFKSVTYRNTCSLKYNYFHDKLMKLMVADPLDKHVNLTNIYYAEKFIVPMKQIDLQYQWKVLELSTEQETFEKVATLVAQWCQPYKLVAHCAVAASLDNIVQQILKVLKDVHPAHSIFSTSAEQFSLRGNNDSMDNYWNAKESRQIIDIIGRVIFRELCFNVCCANSDETYVDPNIFLIDQVLESKRASPILLEIIIQSIARRLGVRCDLLYSPSHLVLSWRESYKISSDCYYIDLFSDGSLVSKKDCLRYHPHEFDMSDIGHLTPAKLALRLTTNLDLVFSRYTDKYLTQSSWMSELIDMTEESSGIIIIHPSSWAIISVDFDLDSCLLDPSEISAAETISDYWSNVIERDGFTVSTRVCTDYENIPKKKMKLNKSDSTDPLLSKLTKYYSRQIQSRLTRKHLKYTIGMLVEIELPFKTAGVITGWTTECSNCQLYLSWPRFGDTSERAMCTMCPVHYKILGCDDIEISVSQEFLKPLKMQKWINNYQIGQYFSHFEGTHYVPNQKLRMLYPMDANILERKYSES